MIMGEDTTPLPDALRNKTIVLSDDDPRILHVLRLILEDAGFENLRCAHEVDDTLELVRRLKPDLVVTDMFKTRDWAGGVKIARALKEDPSLAYIPILLVTASSKEGTFDPELFAEYVPKPFRKEEFLEAVQALLS